MTISGAHEGQGHDRAAPLSESAGPTTPIVTAVAPGYAFEGTALELGGLMLDATTLADTRIRIPLGMLNRHGLVAGSHRHRQDQSPVEYYAPRAGQGTGIPLRVTMTAFGPTLLSKVLASTTPRSPAFFFDEAHLLFADASKAFLDQIAQTVRLIRSKGVGVFFVTQSPTDVPDDVLAQLGSRAAPAPRRTPNDAKALKATVNTYPDSATTTSAR